MACHPTSRAFQCGFSRICGPPSGARVCRASWFVDHGLRSGRHASATILVATDTPSRVGAASGGRRVSNLYPWGFWAIVGRTCCGWERFGRRPWSMRSAWVCRWLCWTNSGTWGRCFWCWTNSGAWFSCGIVSDEQQNQSLDASHDNNSGGREQIESQDLQNLNPNGDGNHKAIECCHMAT